MANKKLTIQLKGAPEDQEHVLLYDFIEQLASIRDTLVELDERIGHSQSPCTDFRIVDLTHSSPARVVLEPMPLPDCPDVGDQIIHSFVTGLQQIQLGSAPDDFDSALLERFARIGKGFRRHITELIIEGDDVSVSLGKSFEAQVATIIGDDEISDGSVFGMLEMINIHGGKNKFTIYPSIGPRKVSCHFPDNLLENAIRAVNRHINVSGKLKYKKRDRFPYGIEVSGIDVLPPESELPSILSLRGIAPDATGSLKSEEFVRRLRNAEH